MKEKLLLAAALLVGYLLGAQPQATHIAQPQATHIAQPKPTHSLHFDTLAKRWDEGMPLGNGWLGALIWQKGDHLRMSLDRVDLWDDRPMPEIDQLKFSWVVEKVKLNQYDSVQKIGDEPYEKYPAPTKIPGAALEFDLAKIGTVVSNTLDISNGLSTIRFSNGVVLNNYVHASKEVGYFGFENLTGELPLPELMIPNYVSADAGGTGNSVEGQGLQKLGYTKGTITRKANSILYHQPTWNGNYYEVFVQWNRLPGNRFIGQWTITNNKKAFLPALQGAEPTGWAAHIKWWNDFWSRSSINIPDTILEKQYYLELYKFGCVARSNTPPISLQAIWTADNGNLPPWKGDFHHDLNTQLSYWPGYASNHLDLTASYTNWLWKVMPENKKWTKQYFGVDGLNVPGVTTISGKAMGGWIQYSMSPTTVAWLAQHFYWQWKYSGDKRFLNSIAIPYFKEAGKFLDAMTGDKKDPHLPLSSSPEFHDNSIRAWFKDYTNYDLSLLKGFYLEKNIMGFDAAIAAGRPFGMVEMEGPVFPTLHSNSTGLTVAPGQDLDQSHRHMSPYMSIYPVGLLSVEDPGQKSLIDRSLRHIEKTGTREWCGYSFSWMSCLYARGHEGDSAAAMLRHFATNFCSINSFHLNGDQKGGQYSSFTYRPFTLEGNFAFAQGVQEMLIQSYQGYIEVFPALPAAWKNVSFSTLRTEGAFLVSAKKEQGNVKEVTLKSVAGGELRLKLPFPTWYVLGTERNNVTIENGIAVLKTLPGQTIIFKNGYE